MSLAELDLNRPAAVQWRNPSPDKPELGNRERRFATITNAVRFVIEDLTDFAQSTASINTESGALTLDDIRRLYSTLPPKPPKLLQRRPRQR